MFRTRVALSILSLLPMLWALACDVPNPPALVILGNVQPDESCTVKTEGGGQQVFIFEGTLDVSLGTEYVGNFMVQNNFPQFESLTGFQPQNAQLDGSAVNLDTVNVTLRLPLNDVGAPILFNHVASGTPDIQDFLTKLQIAGVTFDPVDFSTLTYSLPIQFTIVPTGTGLAYAYLIPSSVGTLFRLFPELLPTQGNAKLKMLADFNVSGLRMDGRRVTSATISYPITVCHNCLVSHNYPESTAVSPFSPPGDSEPLTEDEIGFACVPGADATVTNAFCGFKWPGPGPGDPNECPRNRCLGKGVLATGADNLVCDNDVIVLQPPPPPADAGFF